MERNDYTSIKTNKYKKWDWKAGWWDWNIFLFYTKSDQDTKISTEDVKMLKICEIRSVFIVDHSEEGINHHYPDLQFHC